MVCVAPPASPSTLSTLSTLFAAILAVKFPDFCVLFFSFFLAFFVFDFDFLVAEKLELFWKFNVFKCTRGFDGRRWLG